MPVFSPEHLSEVVIERFQTQVISCATNTSLCREVSHPSGRPYAVPVQARMGPWVPSCSLQGNGLVSSDSWTKMLDFLVKHFM